MNIKSSLELVLMSYKAGNITLKETIAEIVRIFSNKVIVFSNTFGLGMLLGLIIVIVLLLIRRYNV